MTKLLIDLLWLTALLDWVPMLACFLLGLAVGGAGVAWWAHRRQQVRDAASGWKMGQVIAWLLLASSAGAAEVRMEWDRSPFSTITNYTVHIGPNPGTNATIYLQAGTNTTYTANIPTGQWRVWVTATSGTGQTSDPSNVLILDVPAPPTLRLKLQGAASVTGPWKDLATLGVRPEVGGDMAFYRGELEWTPTQ